MSANEQVLFFPELPHFIANPSSSVTLKEKQNLTLPCSAGGFPSPAIMWYKDGDVIEEGRKQFKKRNLEIKEIQFEDRGSYTCTAENILGRVQSSVNVTVKGICCGSILSLVQILFSFVINSLSYITIPKGKGK